MSYLLNEDGTKLQLEDGTTGYLLLEVQDPLVLPTKVDGTTTPKGWRWRNQAAPYEPAVPWRHWTRSKR